MNWASMDWLFSRYKTIGAAGAILAIASVLVSAVIVTGAGATRLVIVRSLVAFWSIAPPAYFFLEFHWARSRNDKELLQRVKESQELAGKIWAGVVAALSVLYLKG